MILVDADPVALVVPVVLAEALVNQALAADLFRRRGGPEWVASVVPGGTMVAAAVAAVCCRFWLWWLLPLPLC